MGIGSAASVPRGADDEMYLMYAAIGHYRSNPAPRAFARELTHGEIALYQTILEAGTAAGVGDTVRLIAVGD